MLPIYLNFDRKKWNQIAKKWMASNFNPNLSSRRKRLEHSIFGAWMYHARTCLNFKKRSTAELSPDHVSRSIVVCCYMTFVDNELLSLWFWRKFNLKRFSHLYARVLASPSNILNRYCTSMTKLQPFHSYFFFLFVYKCSRNGRQLIRFC